MSQRFFIGISLKAYFGKDATLDWCQKVSDSVATHPAVVSGIVELAVFPSHPFIESASQVLSGKNVRVGAQDVSAHPQGPWTGEVTANQLADLGVQFVEVGHAERRRHLGDTDGVVSVKVGAALGVGIAPLLCVGELEDKGPGYAASVCIEQIASAFSGISDRESLSRAVVAYEPVWAIGETQSASSDHILGVHQRIRRYLDDVLQVPGIPIIYGGSAGTGLFGTISDGPAGLFLGRFAHDVDNLRTIVEEVVAVSSQAAAIESSN